VIDEAAGRIALVTGAGSPSGIGLATARALGRAGAAVAIVSTTDRIHERAEELRAEGIDAVGVAGDLTDPAQVRDVVEEVGRRLGPIDILVNNAGMTHVGLEPQVDREFLEHDEASWDRDLVMTLGSAVHVTRAVSPACWSGVGVGS
jgi:3-oxoacyl-[acyl-carrier protein] reductase